MAHRINTFATALMLGLIISSTTSADDAVERGRYIFDLAGCQGCHTQEDGELLAGGRELDTPFGVFYSPNITPDPDTGIGNWTATEFKQALRQGISPEGEHYYPVFPYTSYTAMIEADMDDLWVYLQTLKPVQQSNPDHQLPWPFSWRWLMVFWKWFFFEVGAWWDEDPAKGGDYNRGAYLARALGHCGECHTPRNLFGAMDLSREFAGTPSGPEGGIIPNITADPDTGIGSWSVEDIDALLVMGMLPDADFVGAGMGEVVDNSTGMMSDADREALISFLRLTRPINNRVSDD